MSIQDSYVFVFNHNNCNTSEYLSVNNISANNIFVMTSVQITLLLYLLCVLDLFSQCFDVL